MKVGVYNVTMKMLGHDGKNKISNHEKISKTNKA